MIPEHAAKKLRMLEDTLGNALADMPVPMRDQFAATIRDDFEKMHIDITDPKTAEAAFAGVFIMADAVFTEPVATMKVAQFTAYLLRSLYSRAEGDSVPTSSLPHVKMTWRMRVMDWLAR